MQDFLCVIQSYLDAVPQIATIKENKDKLSVISALPNQHQINVNAWLPPWLEMDKVATHGIPRGVHVDYGLSGDAVSM